MQVKDLRNRAMKGLDMSRLYVLLDRLFSKTGTVTGLKLYTRTLQPVTINSENPDWK